MGLLRDSWRVARRGGSGRAAVAIRRPRGATAASTGSGVSSANAAWRARTAVSTSSSATMVGVPDLRRGDHLDVHAGVADAGVNIEMISTSEVRITCTIAEDQLEAAARALHAAFALAMPDPVDAAVARVASDATAGRLTSAPRHRRVPGPARDARLFLARQERFAPSGPPRTWSAAWLAAGTPEVCLAVADEQTAGRGRAGRTVDRHRPARAAAVARVPPDMARPRARLAARGDGQPRDGRRGRGRRRPPRPDDPPQVAERPRDRGRLPGRTRDRARRRRLRKLGGVLGEADGLGTGDPRVVVGIGVNADWAAADFPPDLAPTMTSLREASGGRPIDRALLLDGFLSAPRGARRGAPRRPLRRRRLGRPPGDHRPARPARGHGRTRRGVRAPSAWTRPPAPSSWRTPTAPGRRARGPRRRGRPPCGSAA